MHELSPLVQQHRDLIIHTRRELHQIPEPAFTEEKTSAKVAEYLIRERLEVQTGIAKYGVVGLIKTAKPGPTLMIRADMDGLI
jgi:metal-dependent amidase/aminoacylase/carboxypeptidase family protein